MDYSNILIECNDRNVRSFILIFQIYKLLKSHTVWPLSHFLNFFQDDEGKAERVKAMDEIKNRFGPNVITKTNTLHRVEGITHFLNRNV